MDDLVPVLDLKVPEAKRPPVTLKPGDRCFYRNEAVKLEGWGTFDGYCEESTMLALWSGTLSGQGSYATNAAAAVFGNSLFPTAGEVEGMVAPVYCLYVEPETS